MTDIQTYNYRN